MTVVVTNATRNAGLAVTANLAAAGHRVISTDDRRLPFGLRSRYAAAHYVYPDPAQDGFIAALTAACERERAEVLLPLSTPVVGAVARAGAALAGRVAFLAPDAAAFAAAADRSATARACAALGIAAPACYGEADAAARLAQDGIELIVKPRAELGGARGVRRVRSAAQLAAALAACASRFGAPMIQDYIPGGVECMRTAIVLFDRGGGLAAYFTTRKLRQWPPDGGVSVVSVSTDEFGLVESVLPLFRRWRWQGPAEVEFKLDPRDGRPWLIEVNPRFPGYVTFATGCGLNLPALACALARGAPAAAPPGYAVGRRYVNPTVLALTLAAELARGPDRRGALSRARAHLRRPWVGLYSATRDPLPLLGKALLRLARAARAVATGRWRRH